MLVVLKIGFMSAFFLVLSLGFDRPFVAMLAVRFFNATSVVIRTFNIWNSEGILYIGLCTFGMFLLHNPHNSSIGQNCRPHAGFPFRLVREAKIWMNTGQSVETPCRRKP